MSPPSLAPKAEGALVYAIGRDTLLRARPIAPERDEARLLTLERVRYAGALLVSLALLLFLIAVWRGERALGWRLAPLLVALAALALAPLNTFSSLSVLFDPTVYYAQLGGAFTASVGALGGAAAIVLLALLLVLRARARVPSRELALGIVAAITLGGPSLLRALSRGVSPPPGGVTVQLWLAWEVALFLAAASLLVGAAAAGSTILGQRRGLPPWLAPALAAGAAFLGPVVLRPPGFWPGWYTVLWVAAIGALALTRPHRRFVLAAASVAALGAATLTWNAGVRGRASLANRDVQGLSIAQPDVLVVLRRLGDSLTAVAPPVTEADLVKVYVSTALFDTDYAVELTSWSPDGIPSAEVALDAVTTPPAVSRLVSEVRAQHTPLVQPVLGVPGVYTVLAVPYANGAATTMVVGPRTRLIADDPFVVLLGLEERKPDQPPYNISLLDLGGDTTVVPGSTRWYREGTEMHGDQLVLTARGPMRAHVEIELPSPWVLAQRGVLVVLVDLVAIYALWLLSAAADGAVGRWTRVRAQRWTRSYRARLGVALFAFFVLPAVAFAAWSYERLQSEDRQSRELLLRETLRSVAGADEVERVDSLGGRTDTPLLMYRDGELQRTSEPLFDDIAPTGRFLPPAVYLSLHPGREVYSSSLQRVGRVPALFGYRSVITSRGETLVLGAPARGNEEALDQRRRDLGVLVLFATVLGAIAALGLSRTASRSLAQPIGALRSAALAIAGGDREPPLAAEPPDEFGEVFSAFRRMAADLGASRAALETAQRRTSTVLRNVASGVIAVAANGAVTLANPRAEDLVAHALPAGSRLADAAPVLASHVTRFLASPDEEQSFELTLGARQLQARLTRFGGPEGGAVLTLDDVTELARAQRVLAWGEMARQVAHEIKNPLTPIRLGIQHLKRARAAGRADFDDVLEQNAQRILAEIDRLDAIARGFSRYGRPPAERAPAEPLDVRAIVHDVVELERLGRGEVEWRLHGDADEVRALAREDELREVMLNVLENARLADASRVDVRFARTDSRVIVEVIDDGRGIPPQAMARLFEPHFSTRTSGSGLGLAISRQLVESWGGEIAVASEEGRGTTVRLELRAA